MIKKGIKKFLIKYLPKSVVNDYNEARGGDNIYFSQEGEDIVLDRFFEGKLNGFYVDIGSHHPIRFSNTYKFYLKGWQGINVDATPGSMKPFNELRERDINLEIGISENEGEMIYHLFDEPALNTFSTERVDFLLSTTTYKLKEKVIVKTKTLQQILKQYLPSNQSIDFLSIDVEGLDYMILATNDWTEYRPKMLLVEDLASSLENSVKSMVYKLMQKNNYEMYARTGNTLFLKDSLIK